MGGWVGGWVVGRWVRGREVDRWVGKRVDRWVGKREGGGWMRGGRWEGGRLG